MDHNTKRSPINWCNLGYGYNFPSWKLKQKLRKTVAKNKIEQKLFPLLSELTTSSLLKEINKFNFGMLTVMVVESVFLHPGKHFGTTTMHQMDTC